MKRFLWPVALVVLAAGCTMIPKYRRPAAPVAADWPWAPAGKTNLAAADVGWRDFFHDPRLQQLIGLALTNNRDLRVAMLNVEAARAQYRMARTDLIPDVAGTGSWTRRRTSASVPFQGGGGGGTSITYNQYALGIGAASYELDLFGRIRSLNQQALEQYLATDEARQAAQLSLVAQVANEYLSEREADELVATSVQTLDTVTNYYRLIEASFHYGNASEVDLRAAEAQVQTARANVAAYTRLREQATDALVLLIGQPLPRNLPRALPLESQRLIPDLPAGLPSDLLARRPDIRAAEHQLKAANANIGAARAAFFPRVALTASAGVSSSALENLFAPGSGTWLFSPEITVPIFDTAYNKANLDLARIQKRIEIARYEKAIQSAFRDVADALAGRATFGEELDAERKLVQAEQKRYELADARYRDGVDNYLAVLLAQQDLYTAQQRLVISRFAQLSNLVSLYQALGGGWTETTVGRATGAGQGT